MLKKSTEHLVKVWDPAVRLFHWSLVALFLIAFLSGDESDGLHRLAGYGICGLLIFRVVWGFVGTRHARFSDFVYAPRKVKHYLTGLFRGKPARYLGHNPAGGAMILALLLSLSITCWTDLKADGAGGELWEEAHEFFSGFTIFLVVLHISGVVVSMVVHRENLIGAMITGRKKREMP